MYLKFRPFDPTMTTPNLYHGRIFTASSNSSNGQVGSSTLFDYHQDGRVVWASYSGGSIVKGFLIATVGDDDSLDMRYEHVNKDRELMTGKCRSVPERLQDGRLKLHETWQWTSGDLSEGTSTLEEIGKFDPTMQ
jgi:hypothetical protein